MSQGASNKAMQADGRFAAAADRQGVTCAENPIQMTDQESTPPEPSERILGLKLWLRRVAILALAISALPFAFYVYAFHAGLSNEQSTWGAFGDFYGGVVGPILSLLGLLALLYTMVIQMEELETSRSDLETSREELKKSTIAIQNQEATASRQLLESTFFQMLRLHGSIVEDIKYSDHRGRKALSIIYEDLSHRINSAMSNPVAGQELGLMSAAYQVFYGHYGNQLGHYFRNMYQIARFINDSEIDSKQTYADLLRAQLSEQEQGLLFYNVAAGRGRRRFLPLVERFALLEHLDESVLMIPEPTRFVDPSAFGASHEGM